MRSRKLFLVLVLATIIFTGCKKGGEETSEKDMSAYEKIQKNIVELQNYEADATIEYISNKGSNVYSTNQIAKITGEYKITIVGPEKVAGNITLFDGQIISQYNPRIAGKVSISTTETMDRSEVLLTTFIRNYLKSQEVSVSVASMDESRCTVLEATIPGDHAYLSTEKLWVDNETLKPVQLIIYDPDGGERVIVSYSNFEYNVEIDDKIFTVE